jgi:hypothetical protein
MRYITKSLTGINTKSRYRGLFLVVAEVARHPPPRRRR